MRLRYISPWAFWRPVLTPIINCFPTSRYRTPRRRRRFRTEWHPCRSQLHELDKEGVGNVSPRELSILQASPAEETIETLIESAGALKELGLVKESAAEYEKAFKKNPFAPDLMPRFMDCLFLFNSPGQIAEYLCPLVDQLDHQKSQKAKLVSDMGLDMEKRGHKDTAIELYKAALMMDPGVSEVEQRLNALMAQMMPGSRYDYLIQEKMVTPGHLQKALVISQKDAQKRGTCSDRRIPVEKKRYRKITFPVLRRSV